VVISLVLRDKNKEPTYRDYVKRGLHKKFVELCHNNSLDFYSCGCILTAHLVLKRLMSHTFQGFWKEKKYTPKQAWDDAMQQTDYHSGASAAGTAIMVAQYSPRGEEFKQWCKKSEVVMVKWDD